MRLSEPQSLELRSLGIFGAQEFCDKCTAVIGPIRWTLAGVPGVWCSRRCRDGIASAKNPSRRALASHSADEPISGGNLPPKPSDFGGCGIPVIPEGARATR